MRFLVVGAGIGGLAAAIALQRDGHSITVVERVSTLGEVGAGIVLGPHAMRALAWLGADSHIRVVNRRPDRMRFHDAISGQQRFSVELGETGQALFGGPFYTSHRRDLIDALCGQLGRAELILGRAVVGIEQDDCHVSVKLEDGSNLEADALIGADGLRSSVRSALLGTDNTNTISTGLLAWRTVLPMTKLREPLTNSVNAWMGGGRHVVCYPTRKGQQFYAAFYVPATEIHREDWSASGNVTELRESFQGACEQLLELVAAVDQAFITSIHYRDPLPVWHSGRALLVGDAAHPVLPTSGSGGGLALEDAVTLAYCVRRHGEDLSAAFSEFEARRRPRTTRVLTTSLADLKAFHDVDAGRAAAAGARARGILRLDPTGHTRLHWLYGHDEIATAAAPFQPLVDLPRRPEALRAFDYWLRAQEFKDSIDEWVSEREAYRRFMEEIGPDPADATIESIQDGSLQGLRVVPRGCDNGPCVLHLHGGYHVYGSAQTGVALAAKLAKAAGGWAFVPSYRLSPEHGSDAAAADTMAAYRWARTQTSRVLLSGEDAGASLALNLAQTLRDNHDALPAALYLLSPFIDKTLEARSIDASRRSDPWVSRLRLLKWAGAYVQQGEPTDPKTSPLFADMQGLPPIRIFVAAAEALVDDARALKYSASLAGVDAQVHEAQDSVHRYPLFDFLPETSAFLADIAAHSRSALSRS